MNNNGKYAAVTLYRDINRREYDEDERNEKIEEFEQELCDLKVAGYTVEGSGMCSEYIYAILTKKLDSSVQQHAKEDQ